ncbi:MAG: rhomboid family intramembrane serine protease [Pseudomonadota bacterium]
MTGLLSTNFPVTLLLIVANTAFFVYSLANRDFVEENLLHVGSVRENREYHRLLTSGFLHGGFIHLAVNMYVLLFFGSIVEQLLGTFGFIIVYFAALLGGSAWSVIENLQKPDYRALGASGATSGVVLSFILIEPFEPLMIFPIPVFMPAVVIGFLFIVGSAILAQRENKTIGHEAHLGGALTGILATILVEPRALSRFSEQMSAFFSGAM